MAAPFDNSPEKSFTGLSNHTGEGVVIDIGTGDGRFVSAAARANPNKFYIGIDANVKPLEKISMKATRKPSKGGLPNALFVQAAVEDLEPHAAIAAASDAEFDRSPVRRGAHRIFEKVAQCGDEQRLRDMHAARRR